MSGLSDGYPGGFPSDRDVEAHFARAAEELRERQATVHERVACPACGAPVGTRCRRVNGITSRSRAPLKHPHRERLRADGLYER